jgi:hypothetical protein
MRRVVTGLRLAALQFRLSNFVAFRVCEKKQLRMAPGEEFALGS